MDEIRQVINQTFHWPFYMKHNLAYDLMNPNYQLYFGERNLSAECAITYTLRELHDRAMNIVGFFDVTTGRRVCGADMVVGGWHYRNGALEMSFKPAIRQWVGPDAEQQTPEPRKVHPKTWELVSDNCHRECEVLHCMIHYLPTWNAE